MNRGRNVLAWGAAVAAVAAAVALGSPALAALTAASGPVENRFSMEEQDLSVVEDFEQTDAYGNYRKVVTYRNDGPTSCWVRAWAGGSNTGVSWEGMDPGWKAGADGYYYWKSPLAAGESTGPFMTKASVEGWGSGDLYVYGESAQAEPFGSAEDAFAAISGEAR